MLIISDGKDTSSVTSVKDAQEAIRRSEVLVYALGVDGTDGDGDEGVDSRALRKLTDDTGGRTEVVRGFNNLKEATGRLADELNQQILDWLRRPGEPRRALARDQGRSGQEAWSESALAERRLRLGAEMRMLRVS